MNVGRPVWLFLSCALACTAALPASAEVTARDIRTETRTRWDFQPGQGPHRYVPDRDYFRPSVAAGTETALPPPPVEPGDYHNPPRTEDRVPPKPPESALKTQTRVDVGFQSSYYTYNEPSLGVRINGPNFGATASGNYALNNSWFLRGDTRFTYGTFNYKGSGRSNHNDNFIFDGRALVGRDFLRDRWAVTPYTGLGYRYLFNDLTGMTTIGAFGYRRRSHYLYLPVGVQPRFLLPNGAQLALTGEADWLLHGWQISELSNVSPAYPNLFNSQYHGYGLRGDVMYEQNGWALGPFVNYWNVGKSDTDCDTGTGASAQFVCGLEPHNTTLEYGIQLRYKIF